MTEVTVHGTLRLAVTEKSASIKIVLEPSELTSNPEILRMTKNEVKVTIDDMQATLPEDEQHKLEG